jgi:hypothetical protein
VEICKETCKKYNDNLISQIKRCVGKRERDAKKDKVKNKTANVSLKVKNYQMIHQQTKI